MWAARPPHAWFVAFGAPDTSMDVEGGCGCWEPNLTREQWVYKGPGMGSYSKVGSLQLVGHGKGDFEKERYLVSSGTKCRFACLALLFFSILAAVVTFLWLAFGANDRGASDPCDMENLSSEMQAQCCFQGHLAFCAHPVAQQIIIHDKYFTRVKNVPVSRTVPVPIPPPAREVIQRKVYVHSSAFDCSADMDWKQQWSHQQQRYCCYKRSIGCSIKLKIRPHYHTITHIKQVTVPVPIPVPAPPPPMVRVVNVPIHDPPKVIKIPVRDAPHVVHQYVHRKQYVPVPEASPPKYHRVPVPVPIKEPGKVIKVPVPLPPKTVVKNQVIYRTRHVQVKRIYDCGAGFENWKYGWSSAKQSWCCSHHKRGCPGTWKGHGLTKAVVTKVTTKEAPEMVEGVPVVVHGAIEGETMA